VPRDPPGVADHRQEVTGRQPFMDGVTHADLLGQQVRVGDRPAKLVAPLGLGTPVDAAVTLDLLWSSIDRPRRVVVEQAIDLFVEDELTDQPAPVGRVAWQVGVLAGEQIFVIDDVAVLEPQEFFSECFCRLAGQLAVQPLQQDLAFRVTRLVCFLRRHLAKLDDILHFSEQRLSIDRVDRLQRPESDLTLLLVRSMARQAIGTEHAIRRAVQVGWLRIWPGLGFICLCIYTLLL